MDSITQESDLKRPPLVATMHYSVRTKTEAIMRLGFYRALRNVKTLFKKSANAKGEEALRALRDGVRRMKLEIKKSVVFHLKDYQENLKFGYFYELIKATSESFAQASLDRFQAYFSDLSTTIEHLGKSQFDKEKATKIFNKMDKISRQLTEKLNRIKSEIESSR